MCLLPLEKISVVNEKRRDRGAYIPCEKGTKFVQLGTGKAGYQKVTAS